MRIGYSFWGFLGSGVTDTPDGGRSHRRSLIDGLVERGHDVVFLQHNRDLVEANDTSLRTYRWHSGLPEIDTLMLEWRWPIPGRNTTRCGTPGHTCDLHRQDELIRHYIETLAVPTLLWDKDQQLALDDPLRSHPAVTVCEAALAPTPGARSLLFPVPDRVVASADPVTLAAQPRDLALVYVGNQYDRDDAFDRLFAPAAARHPHLVAGNWPHTRAWPHVRFIGRRPFGDVERLHRQALTTILLAPGRYARSGQITQRLFEAVLAGCLPLGPSDTHRIGDVLPSELLVDDGDYAADRIADLRAVAGTRQHADLLAACLDRLDRFRLSRQLDVINDIFSTPAPTPCGRGT